MGLALLPKHQVRQLLRQRAYFLCKYQMGEIGKTWASPLEMTSSYAEVICFGKVGGQLLRLAHFSG